MAARPKLPPEANRILFVKNLAYNVDAAALFELFAKYGPVRQIRSGSSPATKGTAYVVYEDVIDAKQACDKLNGFNFMNRYLVVLYHQPEKIKVDAAAAAAAAAAQTELEARRANLDAVKREHGID